MTSKYDDFYKAMKQLIDEDAETTDEEKTALLKQVEAVEPYARVIEKKEAELELTEEERFVLKCLADRSLTDSQPGSARDVTLIQLVSMMFIRNHREAVMALNDPTSRLDLVNSITKKDLEEIKLDRKDPKVAALLKCSAPTLEEILDVIGFGNAIIIYERHNKFRTKSKAAAAGAITVAPAKLAIPTISSQQYSMSLYNAGESSYLQPLRSMDGLSFKDGYIYFNDMREVTEAELRDLRTNEGIEDLDLIQLRFYYSILFNQFQLSNNKVLQDIVPVSASILTGRNNPNEKEVKAAIAKVKSFHNVMGVLKDARNGRVRESYYQVLNFEYYDDKRNIIAFSSPYMNHVIDIIFKIATIKNPDGKPKLNSRGTPQLRASHSFVVDASIRSERNKAAAMNVEILVTLIEQAGGNLPNIKADTLIQRNVQLAKRLSDDPQHKAQLLNRVFTKTWELLKTKTNLTQRYKNLRLSIDRSSDGVLLEELDPTNPAFIPTAKNMKDLCFYFPNDGKQKT